MTTPNINGTTPFNTLVTGGGTYQQQVNTIIAQMRAAGDTSLATEFASYAAGFHVTNPTLTAQDALSAYLANELGTAVGAGVGGTTAVLGQVPQAAATGAENAVSKLDSIGSFNLGSWFMRVGEILLGLVLIGVGIARITGAQNVISKALKVGLP